jgi:hypothetical protein
MAADIPEDVFASHISYRTEMTYFRKGKKKEKNRSGEASISELSKFLLHSSCHCLQALAENNHVHAQGDH